jgi:hypothetical protein
MEPTFTAEECKRRWEQALAELERLKRERPIGSGGLKFTRAELYDRYPERAERKLGTMPGSVLHIAPDFDEPLEDFREYM